MDANMANSLVVVLLLLLLESTVETVPFQQCCPEDDQHVFIHKQNICKSSRTLGLVCNHNNSGVAVLRKHDNAYWFKETNDSVIVGSKYFGMAVSHESFCLANVTPLYDNWEAEIYSDGIVLCADTKPSGTYLGPELLSYVVCTLISGIGCLLTFLTYIVVPALRRELLNKCLICTLLCSTFAYVSFAVTLKEVHMLSLHYCAYQMLFVLFWGVAAVFWTNVVSFHIWRTVVFKRFPINEARLLKVYHFWGWGIPLILLVTATSLEAFVPDGEIYFFICHANGVAFIAITMACPFLLFFNLLYFIWTIWKLCRQEVPSTSDLKFTRFQRLQKKYFLYLKLFLMMGILWILRLITSFLPITIGLLLDCLTLLQGLFLFLVLVVFQKKAYLGLAEQFAKWGCPCPFVTTNLAALSNENSNEDDINVDGHKDDNKVDAHKDDYKVDAQKDDDNVDAQKDDDNVDAQKDDINVDAQKDDYKVDAQKDDNNIDAQKDDDNVETQKDAAVFNEIEIKTEP